jgi:hypothetical protein
MKRGRFMLTMLASVPAIAFANTVSGKLIRAGKGFKVGTGEARRYDFSSQKCTTCLYSIIRKRQSNCVLFACREDGRFF